MLAMAMVVPKHIAQHGKMTFCMWIFLWENCLTQKKGSMTLITSYPFRVMMPISPRLVQI